jgi:SAM-dependent methyltransferase
MDVGQTLTGAMPEDHFDEDVASGYDQSDEPEFDPAVISQTVDFLAALAGDGPALELAIGTGRLALPLAARGVAVSGIDLSEAMVRRLRAKEGGKAIPVAMGDIATTVVEGAGTFSLAYLVYNTIENLTTQAGQVAAFRNAARHLRPGGAFVIECVIPDLRRLAEGTTAVVFAMGERHWGIDEYDVANQGLVSHHFNVVDGRVEYGAWPFRYVWPAELDLMAELAGLRLAERWAGWNRAPFTSDSRGHVSVWRKPG